MLDMEGIYQMVHNQTTIKRASDYVREGRMQVYGACGFWQG